MDGKVNQAFVNALRSFDLVKNENMGIVIAGEDGEVIINTALPAIAVHTRGLDSNSGTYIGGTFQQGYSIDVCVIINLDNFSASPDNYFQYNQMDLAYRLANLLNKYEYIPFFDELRKEHDFSMVLNGIRSDVRRGFIRDMEDIKLKVYKINFRAGFLNKDLIEENTGLPLERVEIECKGVKYPTEIENGR